MSQAFNERRLRRLLRRRSGTPALYQLVNERPGATLVDQQLLRAGRPAKRSAIQFAA